MKRLLIICLLISLQAIAQRANNYVSRGNEHYLRLEWDLAEAQYRKALEMDPRNAEGRYNLGNTLMQQEKYKAALEMYEGMTSDNKNLLAAAHYNAGVSYTKQKDLPASIEAYKAALRINANDKEARENLQKALQELKQQQNQQNKQNSGGGGMSESQADKKLRDLQEKERELQQKMQQGQNKGSGGGRDW